MRPPRASGVGRGKPRWAAGLSAAVPLAAVLLTHAGCSMPVCRIRYPDCWDCRKVAEAATPVGRFLPLPIENGRCRLRVREIRRGAWGLLLAVQIDNLTDEPMRGLHWQRLSATDQDDRPVRVMLPADLPAEPELVAAGPLGIGLNRMEWDGRARVWPDQPRQAVPPHASATVELAVPLTTDAQWLYLHCETLLPAFTDVESEPLGSLVMAVPAIPDAGPCVFGRPAACWLDGLRLGVAVSSDDF